MHVSTVYDNVMTQARHLRDSAHPLLDPPDRTPPDATHSGVTPTQFCIDFFCVSCLFQFLVPCSVFCSCLALLSFLSLCSCRCFHVSSRLPLLRTFFRFSSSSIVCRFVFLVFLFFWTHLDEPWLRRRQSVAFPQVYALLDSFSTSPFVVPQLNIQFVFSDNTSPTCLEIWDTARSSGAAEFVQGLLLDFSALCV